MLSKLHHSLQNKDLGSEQANVFVKTALHQVEQLDRQFAPNSPKWEEEMIATQRLVRGVEEGSLTIKVHIAGMVKRHWDDLSAEFKSRYNYSFDAYTILEVGLEPTTMDNYLRADNTFLVKGMKPAGPVEIPARDEQRKVVYADGSLVVQRVEFDATRVPITKLARLRHAAEAGLMERGQCYERGWAMMMDPEVSVSDIDTMLYKKENNGGNDPSLRFYLEGVSLVGEEFGEIRELGEFYPEMWADEAGKRMIYYVLRALRIKIDEDWIARKATEASKSQILRYYGEQNES